MKKLDLTGRRYGKLTVLGPAENIGSKTAWLCRCDCGRETVIRTTHLQSGDVTTCGCQFHLWGTRNPTCMNERTQRKRLDLTGQRFGKLIALRPAEDINGKSAWLCRCDCGRETVAKTANLRSGHTRTCGCRNSSCLNLPPPKRKPARKNDIGGSGVEWLPERHQWKVTVCRQGTLYHLGPFSSFQDALDARKRTEEASSAEGMFMFIARAEGGMSL